MKRGGRSHNLDKNTTNIILESISDGVFTVNHRWEITSFNRAAEDITGVPREEAINRHCWEVFRSNMCEGDCALKKTMKEGKAFISASGFIVDSNKKRIPVTVSTALLKDKEGNVVGGVETFRDKSVEEELRKELLSKFQLRDIVSRSDSMNRILKILPQIAESGSSVLIEGETGTGKELIARAIHNLSPRKNRPFVAVNCGALPDTLLESELFGYKAGAFTGAFKNRQGHFASAEGGTILLDEIGDASPAFQVKLLRVLHEHEFQPLGAEKKIRTDVRIIAATNKDLFAMVERGEFRRDLFYRINVIQIKLPPLRERTEDIPILVDRFIAKLNRIRKKSVKGIDRKVFDVLMSYSFPGNIRELENIIEHAFVLCSEDTIRLRHLPANLSMQSFERDEDGCKRATNPVRLAEIRVITDALKRNNYNRNATAKDLGIHKTTLFRKIKKLGIKLPEIDGRSGRKRFDAGVVTVESKSL